MGKRTVSFLERNGSIEWVTHGNTTLLNLENNRIRGLALNLPQIAVGQPLPCVGIESLLGNLSGFWGLFEIRLQADLQQQSQLIRIPLVWRRYACVFRTAEGKVFLPTARHIWGPIQTVEPKVQGALEFNESPVVSERLLNVAEQAGQELFDALQQEHRSSIAREADRGLIAFGARRMLSNVLIFLEFFNSGWRGSKVKKLNDGKNWNLQSRLFQKSDRCCPCRWLRVTAMRSWRDAILNYFVPHVSKLTLLADPDSLLTEERLAIELRNRGFDLIEFNDPVEFRYAYESKYRSIWDQGEHTDLVVILRLQDLELGKLPYDLLNAGRKLAFDLGSLFPNMSYPVIENHDYLANRKGNGSEGSRSDQSRTFAVNNLIKIWVTSDSELVSFRDKSLAHLRRHPSMALPIHWSMISTVYPFWFNAAGQIGRLLNLQDQVTQQQIINRLKEQYGDRQTASRYARFVIRSLVAWGVLKDSDAKGCYERVTELLIRDKNLTILMFEAALHTTSESKGVLGLLLNNPVFFPFQLPVMTSDFVARRTDHIDVVRDGLDDDLLKLKKK